MGRFKTLVLTSPHIKAKRVVVAQHLLAGHGPLLKQKVYHGAEDGEYGPQTAGAAKHAKFIIGYPKRKCSTSFGNDLYLYLSGKRKPSLVMRALARRRAKAARKRAASGGTREKAYALAGKEVGYKETPVNMTKFGAWYGVNGVAWCAIFVSWVLSHVGRPFKESYVPTIVANARAGRGRTRVIPYSGIASSLRAGHVVLACFDWPGESPGTADHVGFVTATHGGGNFSTIEGNTSVANQSNGGEVMRRSRNASMVQAFVVVY